MADFDLGLIDDHGDKLALIYLFEESRSKGGDMMRKTSLILGILGTAMGLFAGIAPVQAQATRTWVSGVGDDANPCSRTAPCKTFAGAISKTAASGVINCIDPGGFGAVTITKSITIDCKSVEAGLLASGTNGVTVNGANVVVALRGLTIEGFPGTGLTGVNFIQGSALEIDQCKILGFQGGSTAFGVNFVPGTNAELHMVDTVVSSNGSAVTGGGIRINPTGAATAKVTLDGVQLVNNLQGLRVDGAGGTGARRVSIVRSAVSGNTFQGIVGTTTTTTVSIMVGNNAITNNGSIGVQSVGAQSVVMIGNNVIAGNDVGISASGSGQLISYSTNNINLNITNNGTNTSTQTPQ